MNVTIGRTISSLSFFAKYKMVARILTRGVAITVRTPSAISPMEFIEDIEATIESSDIVCFSSTMDELPNAIDIPKANRATDMTAPDITMWLRTLSALCEI